MAGVSYSAEPNRPCAASLVNIPYIITPYRRRRTMAISGGKLPCWVRLRLKLTPSESSARPGAQMSPTPFGC